MQEEHSPPQAPEVPLGPHARLLLRALQPYTAEVHHRISRIERRMNGVEGGVAEAEKEVRGIEQRITDIESVLAQVNRDAQGRIDEVVSHLADANRGVHHLEALLSAPMYMTEPEAFRLPEADGGGLGFRQRHAPTTLAPEAFYRTFEDIFRGPADHVRELQRAYLPMLPPHGRIADIGCGRGEFLSLLSEADIDRVGVDMDADMAAVASAAGDCEVVIDNGVDWLLTQPEGSLAAVFAAQVIEHLTAGDVERFLRAAYRALDPECGVLIAETVNPYFIPAFRMFWVDLTHECLIYPEVALAMAKATGFSSGDIHFPGGSGDPDRDRLTVGAYALIARRGPAASAG